MHNADRLIPKSLQFDRHTAWQKILPDDMPALGTAERQEVVQRMREFLDQEALLDPEWAQHMRQQYSEFYPELLN